MIDDNKTEPTEEELLQIRRIAMELDSIDDIRCSLSVVTTLLARLNDSEKMGMVSSVLGIMYSLSMLIDKDEREGFINNVILGINESIIPRIKG